MKKLFAILSFTLLSGCAGLTGLIPSFWDDNQSARITSVRLDIERVDCKAQQLPQVAKIRDDLAWFKLYSESKGFLQKDVMRVVEPIKKSVDEWVQRGEGSKSYCTIKRKLLVEQTTRAAAVVLGRF